MSLYMLHDIPKLCYCCCAFDPFYFLSMSDAYISSDRSKAMALSILLFVRVI